VIDFRVSSEQHAVGSFTLA